MASAAPQQSSQPGTPGPWYLADSADGAFTVREEASDYVIAVVSDGGHVDPQFALSPATIRANGHKMAAADALYEALLDAKGLADMAVMADDFDGSESEDQQSLIRLRAKIDAALALARGEQA